MKHPKHKNFVGAALAVVGSVVGGVAQNMALKKQAKMQNSAQNHEQSMFGQQSQFTKEQNAFDAKMQTEQLDYQYSHDYTNSADNLISSINEQESITRKKQSTEMIVLAVLAASLIGGYVYLKKKS